jgi:divinyl protochlorophyllide a 8-vinyl-reductase
MSNSARVGPNAAIQVFAALQRRDESAAKSVARRAGLSPWLDAPPQEMIAETDAARLHAAVRATLAPDAADAVLAEAGRTTADYLLSHRIPKLAQWALRAAPARLAAKGLARAISANAWTFAGSGRFSAAVDEAAIFEIYDNPFCAGQPGGRRICVWHAGVFERLFQTLVSPHAQVRETACCAANSPCCRFLLSWRRPA